MRLHEQLRVGIDDDGLPVHRSFISPKDDALGGPDAHDPIEERTLRDGGYEARDKLIGVAAELVRSGAGFELATRAEGGERVPNVGLVVQSHANFYAPLLAPRPPEGSVIAARKRGQGQGDDLRAQARRRRDRDPLRARDRPRRAPRRARRRGRDARRPRVAPRRVAARQAPPLVTGLASADRRSAAFWPPLRHGAKSIPRGSASARGPRGGH